MMIQGAPVVLGGKKKSNVPAFAYTGKYNVRDDDVVELLESGEITFVEDGVIDVFMVGGGGGGGWNPLTSESISDSIQYGGGGGGYTRTVRRLTIPANTQYNVTIGLGGAHGNTGGASAFGNELTVNGGEGAPSTRHFETSGKGGAGGSGGGGGTVNTSTGGTGGSDGENGVIGSSATYNAGGTGQGFTTREFGETNAKLYGGGGGGGRSMVSQTPIVSMGGAGGGGSGGWVNPNQWRDLYQAAAAGVANTGGGGGGGYQMSQMIMRPGASGGSGIVCFRDAQELPELAGTWVLNERLYAPESAFTETVSFQAAAADGGLTNVSKIFIENAKLKYNIQTSISIYTMYDFSTNTWDHKYPKWTFPSGATASDEFRAWLASNASKQS